jgi:hypothetical protein
VENKTYKTDLPFQMLSLRRYNLPNAKVEVDQSRCSIESGGRLSGIELLVTSLPRGSRVGGVCLVELAQTGMLFVRQVSGSLPRGEGGGGRRKYTH